MSVVQVALGTGEQLVRLVVLQVWQGPAQDTQQPLVRLTQLPSGQRNSGWVHCPLLPQLLQAGQALATPFVQQVVTETQMEPHSFVLSGQSLLQGWVLGMHPFPQR